jgi:hypothetical protein
MVQTTDIDILKDMHASCTHGLEKNSFWNAACLCTPVCMYVCMYTLLDRD